MSVLELLAVLGTVPPRAWDWIVPHGPVNRVSLAELVGLNPQPEPPREAYLRGSAEVAREVAKLAVADGARGESASWVADVVDDWCKTGWPRKFPLPFPPRPEPEPQPDWRPAGLALAAVVLASTATRLADGEVGALLGRGAEQLANAAADVETFRPA